MAGWTDDDRIAGPDTRPERPALAEAIRLARHAERRRPTPDDAPDIELGPISRAQRAALEISRSKAKRTRKTTW